MSVSLDEGYFLHCEDLDWCMRFRQRGWKIMFVPDARVIHHKGDLQQNSADFCGMAQTQRDDALLLVNFSAISIRVYYCGLLDLVFG
jgi:GT2 family glycosyltransferase